MKSTKIESVIVEVSLYSLQTDKAKKIDVTVSFSNFCLDKNGELSLRVQYHYDPSFTGVGYVLLSELLNGFDSE